MTEYTFEFQTNKNSIIKVIGVGGGGSNAVNQMYREGIRDVDFVVCNTDLQALKDSPVPTKVQLGKTLTEGLGAGNRPEQGREAAIESLKEIEDILDDHTKMVFITSGMGGGTGTGAAPVIAKAAKERGILTVAIVTIPFIFEGSTRKKSAMHGIEEMRPLVDSLLIINNERLKTIYGNEGVSSAFKRADDVLLIAAKGIAEIITVHGYINVDFEDVKTVMKDSGVAIMGSAIAEGQDRAIAAIKEALTSPLLNDNDIRGARDILLNMTYGANELTMDEITEITKYVEDAVGDSANIIWGTGYNHQLNDEICVTIIATGFETQSGLYENDKMKKTTGVQMSGNKNAESKNPEQIGISFPDAGDSSDMLVDEKKYSRFRNVDDLHDDSQLDELEQKPAFKRSMENNSNNE
jgi:cell division protein FtsZ